MRVAIICFANYCRSPVAEKILQSKEFDNVEFRSYGLNPKLASQMDTRSVEYLKNIGIHKLKNILVIL